MTKVVPEPCELTHSLNEEALVKLKQENTSLELGMQSHNELVMEIATEMVLNRMGEDDNEEDDDDEGDAMEDTIATAPTVANPEDVAEEEEDSEMLIPE
jgi:hypothetical protein